jgi:hypothetical protein
MSWQTYLDYLMSQGVCESCYLLDHECKILATSTKLTALPTYEMVIEDENGKEVKIVVDERANLLEAVLQGGPCSKPGGIRLHNQKYIAVNADKEKRILYLKKTKGGACVVQTNKCVVVGTFNSDLSMENKVAQNPGELNKRVEALAEELKKVGY